MANVTLGNASGKMVGFFSNNVLSQLAPFFLHEKKFNSHSKQKSIPDRL
jgi:hypothetical protein